MSRIRFEIVPPVEAPPEPVFVVGSLPELGEWHHGGALPLWWDPPYHVGTVQVPEGVHFEYKITRGSWEREAVSAWGDVPENLHHATWLDATLRHTVADWKDRFAGRLTRDRVWSERLAGPRELLVWLPPEYAGRPSQRFPVLYFFDGDNVFDPETSPLSRVDWAADEWCRMLARAGEMPPAIVVGVRHPEGHGEDGRSLRDIELSFDYRGQAFSAFAASELVAYIDSRYRTLANPAARILCGGSLGALNALVTTVENPEVFGRAVCFSTAFADTASHLPGQAPVLAALENLGQLPGSLRVFFGYGDEGLDECYEPYHQELGGILRAGGWRDGDQFTIVRFGGGTHSEISWRGWLGDGLRFVSQRSAGAATA